MVYLTLLVLCITHSWTLINCQNPMKTFKGNAGGADCVFPFKYKGKMYSRCTTIDNQEKPWCGTTPDYDNDGRWGRCDMRIPGKRTKGGNGSGRDCVFPFQYKGETFSNCIYRDNKKPWCATTNNYPRDKKWGTCISYLTVPTTGGNSLDSSQCVFPFLYQGEQRSGCIVDVKDGSWCATTENYDRDRRWAKCVINEASAGICRNSYALYSDSYSLKGRGIRSAKTKEECESECNMRSSCIGYDFNKNPGIVIKCSVHDDMSNFRSRNTATGVDQYVVIRRCAATCNTQFERLDNTLSYGGSDVRNAFTISDCSSACNNASDCVGFDYDANQGAPVKCFIHKSMANFGSRRSAENVVEFVVTKKICSSVTTNVGNNNTPMCYFPYKYQGKIYSTCNSKNWHKPWCATTPDYDRDGQWGDCDVPAQ